MHRVGSFGRRRLPRGRAGGERARRCARVDGGVHLRSADSTDDGDGREAGKDDRVVGTPGLAVATHHRKVGSVSAAELGAGQVVH